MVKALFVGDWGKAGSQLDRVSASMNAIGNTRSIFFLGDNFYEVGVKSVDDDLWNKVFLTKFRPDRRYFAILGNHDYLSNEQAQVEFQRGGWTMPNRFYSVKLTMNCLVIALDTIQLAPSASQSFGIMREKLRPAQTQLKWLEHTLSTARASSSQIKWIIVLGHYPVISDGVYGDSVELRSVLKPLFRKYSVNLYISGHEHNFQHLTEDGITYIVCGSGSKTNHPLEGGRRLLWGTTAGGFLELDILSERLEGVFCDETGRVTYSFRL